MNDKYKKYLLALKERLENELASLQEQLDELKELLSFPIENKGMPKILANDSGMVRTGQFWLKNKFAPSLGYATGNSFRILYELQDEGPNFIPDYSGHDGNLEFGTFQQAKKYVEEHRDPGTVYRIISPEGEIVR